jgi:hypothetical protein
MLRDLFLLRPDVIFLNHGSFGACPRPVFAAYQSWQLELERQPVEFLGRRFTGLMAQARAALAGFVGAEADDLVYVPNATTGLNVVARSLPLRPGDEVLATDHEYGALDRTWRFICQKRGATYINHPAAAALGIARGGGGGIMVGGDGADARPVHQPYHLAHGADPAGGRTGAAGRARRASSPLWMARTGRDRWISTCGSWGQTSTSATVTSG